MSTIKSGMSRKYYCTIYFWYARNN